jgi:integrase
MSRFQHLDRDATRQLTPGQKIVEHGISAECLPGGDIRYSVQFRVDGQRIHRIIGLESEGANRTQAETFIEQKRAEARENRLALPRGRKTALGFSAAADSYLAKLEESGGRNMANKHRHFALHLKPFFRDQSLAALTTFAVDRYKKHRRDAGARCNSVNRDLATLSHLLSMAVEWKWLAARPCKVRLLPADRGRITVLSDADADALMAAAIADRDPYCWLFVAFGLNTAMRHAEISRARFDHVDFDNLLLHVPEAKAGARDQPITPGLRDILLREREMATDPDGFVFPTRRPSLSQAGHRARMEQPFARAVVAAGLDPHLVTPHVMRHTAITNLVQSGADIPTIMKISGHKTVAMVMRYVHVHGRHVAKAIMVLDRVHNVPETSHPPATRAPARLKVVR